MQQKVAIALRPGPAHEARRYDLIRVDIGDIERHGDRGDGREGLHQAWPSITGRPASSGLNVGEAAGDGRRRDHGRRHQVGARAGPLAAAEIAIGRARTAIAGRDRVAVHGNAHRAAGGGPFQPRVGEDAIEPLLLRLALDLHRAGRDQAGHLGAASREHRGGGAQILDPRVGAGTDEDAVDGDAVERPAGHEAHVVDRIGDRARLDLVRDPGGVGHARRDRQRILRAVAPGDDRRDLVRRRGPPPCRIRHRRRWEGRARPRPTGRNRCPPALTDVPRSSHRSSRPAPPCRSGAPASIDMLQRVMRPSMERPRIVPPAYSMAWPTAPSAPIRAMIDRMTSLAATPGASGPSTVIRICLGLRCQSVCVASTWATSDAPMPKA